MYARRRLAVTAGDEAAHEALRALQRIDLSRLSTPGLFVHDLMDAAWKLEDEAEAKGYVKPLETP